MSDEIKAIRATLISTHNRYDLGTITGNFAANRYPGEPLLDTRVELSITPFSITWERKEELMAELEKVLAKYQI